MSRSDHNRSRSPRGYIAIKRQRIRATRHLALSPEADDTTGPPVRCIGNDALACVVCGVSEEGAQYVVLSGNPVDGLTHTGPFNSSDLAGRWAEEGGGDEWWIVTLESPETD